MPVHIDTGRFDELVSDALDRIPEKFARAIDNVVFLVEDRDPDDPHLLGVYVGVALDERDSNYAGSLPDRIMIFREPLMEMCDDEDDLVHEIEVTVRHELGHYFGLDEKRLHELGWG
ncbi:metallopeptidase family protein [Smaragdicoccus niigatensis]|uniref:metallopeptidase family protein n=1 Tax=Smaragdicoccus niigatensis TaxID=359359 RepID=UPI00036D3EEB|nr:metallopeptidase family protein [Smaragdicoccus niigatensis]